jgi:predicted CXXCH cytochrome family protein
MGRERKIRLALLAPAAGAVLLLGAAFAVREHRVFVPGPTSNGHHLFEARCAACHTPFDSVPNDRCSGCHARELAGETHPARVFDDLRWAEDLARLDARRCTTCHDEHRLAEGGVTVAGTFCFACHDDVVEKRPTHARLGPATCGTGGCHNYHDNSTLSLAFLRKQLGGAAPRAPARVLERRPAAGTPGDRCGRIRRSLTARP